MGLGRQRRDRPATGRATTGYRSARAEQEAAAVAVGLAVTVLTVEAVFYLVSAALTGWALTIDPDGFSRPPAELDVSPAVEGMLATATGVGVWLDLATVVTILAGAAAVIRGQTRALHNLPPLAVEGPRRSAGWAGLVWFVPVLGLYAPKQTFDELWRSGEAEPTGHPGAAEPGGHPGADRPAPPRPPGILALWWSLWVGSNLLDAGLAVALGESPSTGQLLAQQLVSVLLGVAMIGSGVLLRRIVGQITRRQDARHAALTVPSAWR